MIYCIRALLVFSFSEVRRDSLAVAISGSFPETERILGGVSPKDARDKYLEEVSDDLSRLLVLFVSQCELG